MVQTVERFEGVEYDRMADKLRLTKQIGRVYRAMQDGAWRTLEEIAQITGDGESSISAQLRNLRKRQFGSWTVARRPRGDRAHGLWEYCVRQPQEQTAGQLELAEDIVNDLTRAFFAGVRS